MPNRGKIFQSQRTAGFQDIMVDIATTVDRMGLGRLEDVDDDTIMRSIDMFDIYAGFYDIAAALNQKDHEKVKQEIADMLGVDADDIIWTPVEDPATPNGRIHAYLEFTDLLKCLEVDRQRIVRNPQLREKFMQAQDFGNNVHRGTSYLETLKDSLQNLARLTVHRARIQAGVTPPRRPRGNGKGGPGGPGYGPH